MSSCSIARSTTCECLVLSSDYVAADASGLYSHLTAYSPLGNNMINEPLLVANEDVKKLAEQQKVTPAQLLLAWIIKRGASVIPKSVSASRIKENFQQVELSDEGSSIWLSWQPCRLMLQCLSNSV